MTSQIRAHTYLIIIKVERKQYKLKIKSAFNNNNMYTQTPKPITEIGLDLACLKINPCTDTASINL